MCRDELETQAWDIFADFGDGGPQGATLQKEQVFNIEDSPETRARMIPVDPQPAPRLRVEEPKVFFF